MSRGVAADLAARGLAPVLVGRDEKRLRKTAADLGLAADAKVVAAAGADRIAAEITRQRPAVVVNTIGDYADTAVRIARACMPGGHYLDFANDLTATPRLLGLHQEAAAAGSTLVTDAGFGVLGTEAVVAKLREGRPAPDRVRIDALPSVATEGGVMGAALAASIVDVLATGGRRYVNGRLAKARFGVEPQRLALPDGETARSAGGPSGELVAAQRVSGAPNVTATSALVPTAPAAGVAMSLVGKLLTVPTLRRVAVRGMARISVKPAPRPRQHSWGHAVVHWSDGTRREGWLRAGEAMDFTVAVGAETAARLARGEGEPGAYTPAAALGPEVAIAAGGTFVLE
ncbi:saccharopine dehydrogenase NADP-binding domain-containing protein [Streptomyces boninensis]|uniref:saccharopine dehydrogenase NADP-binding domain-containing protein n=1 Tax=Streptomyces boninensis TaxID=2039455 RepID=UPI003B219403